MPQPTNLLLETLPSADHVRMLAIMESVSLPVHSMLYEAGVRPKYAYFLTDGIASVVINAAGGQIAEVAIIGREGLSGATHLLGPLPIPAECFMQIAGSARRLLLSDLETLFRNSPPMRTRVLEFVQMIGVNTSQLAACNALHSLDQRLARWLLVVQDRMGSPSYLLTHEFLAEMLVVQRPTLSIAAASLQRDGIIQYRHGNLRILDRDTLERCACECYHISRDLLQRLYYAHRKQGIVSNGPAATKPKLEQLRG
jgi:CRP-like cAMP-binding protein